MPQKWYQKATIQVALVTGAFTLAAALIAILPDLFGRSDEDRDQRHADRTEASAPPRIQSPIISRLHLEQNLGWSNFFLGMTAAQVAYYSGTLDLEPRVELDYDCVGTFIYAGVVVHMFFPIPEGGPLACTDRESLVLRQILLEFTSVEAAMPRGDLVGELKRQIPSLRYAPSRHDAALTEDYNESPTYTVGELGEFAILLKPAERELWLSYFDWLE